MSREHGDLGARAVAFPGGFAEKIPSRTAALEVKVGVNTVSFHVRKIYDKLQVHSRSDAVAKALSNRIV